MPKCPRHLRERRAEHETKIVDIELRLRGRNESVVQINDGLGHGGMKLAFRVSSIPVSQVAAEPSTHAAWEY
jgi:hypothetical protein